MKSKLILLILIILSLFTFTEFYDVSAKSSIVYRGTDDDIATNIEEIIDKLDLTELESFLATLTEQQKAFLGGGSAKDFLKLVIDGGNVGFSDIIGFLLSSIGTNFKVFIPLMLSLIAITIAYSIINSIKSKFASESVENIIRFACMGVILILLITQVFFVIKEVVKTLNMLKKQTDIVFPILLTLMTAIGAGASVNIYRPAVIMFASGIINLIVTIAIPLFIVSVVLTAIGNLSKGIKLKEMSSFFTTVSKWIMNTTFFIFMGFLSIQGISASVYDGISIRTTKFALSKYVPVIGGYLSEGFNLVMAGSVLIKNSLGLTAIMIMLVTVLPHIIQVALLSLSLRLTAAIAEPLGSQEISGVIAGFGKNLNLLISMILGVGFMYFIFIMLIIATGNLSL